MEGYYNTRQKLLVETCERFHEKGICHTGLSGSLAEDLLISFLKKDVKGCNFFKGQIQNGKNFSSQIDIIICKGSFHQNPLFKKYSKYINVVPIKQVIGIIEVKKWTAPKMISSNGPLKKLKRKYNKSFKGIPFMLVTYRFHDRLRNKKYIRHFNKTGIDTYCLFGQYHTRNRKILFPTDEDCWNSFKEECHYQGEYERLVLKIKTL